MKRSPTLEGFKAIFRQPSVGLAEIAWRWSLGFAGVSLFILALIEYFDTLPVTGADMLLLRSHQPALVGRAFADILSGSAVRVGEACVLLGIAFAVAWIAASSLGRAATLKALLNDDTVSPPEVVERPWRLRSLIGLNALRAAATLAAAVGWWGAIVLGRAVSNGDNAAGMGFLVFLAIILLVNLAWLAVNWFLSLTSIFVVAREEDTFGAMGSAADFCRGRTGAISAVGFWFGLVHFAAFFVASSAAVLLLSFLTILPGVVVLCGVLLVTLLYFAVADYLYVGRLAAYVYLAQYHEDPVVLDPVQPVPSYPVPPISGGRIDPDELFLSDLPLPASP